MYSEVYSLIRDILNDEELNGYILKITGKHLAVIDAGAQITSPAVKILFNGGEITRASNTKQDISFILSFALPFWGNNAFSDCLSFLEFITPILFMYTSEKGSYISRINPAVNEQDNVNNFWFVNINITISTFI